MAEEKAGLQRRLAGLERLILRGDPAGGGMIRVSGGSWVVLGSYKYHHYPDEPTCKYRSSTVHKAMPGNDCMC